MTGGALVLLFLLFGLAFTVGLYVLIREETSNPKVVDRTKAEREAQEVGGLDAGDGRRASRSDRGVADDDDDASDGWGTESRWDR